MERIDDLSQYKQFIFDLDNTLLFGDFKLLEENYFKEVLNIEDDIEIFLDSLRPSLSEYEVLFPRYSIKTLSKYLSIKLNMEITPTIIEGWIDLCCNTKDKVEENAIELLSDLKNKGKNIVILTNWFEKTQVERLKNSGLLKYIDKVYSGEEYTKPSSLAYLNASYKYGIKNCVMIGDSYEKDYIGPRTIGMYSILYDPEEKRKYECTTIKSLAKIKGRF